MLKMWQDIKTKLLSFNCWQKIGPKCSNTFSGSITFFALEVESPENYHYCLNPLIFFTVFFSMVKRRMSANLFWKKYFQFYLRFCFLVQIKIKVWIFKILLSFPLGWSSGDYGRVEIVEFSSFSWNPASLRQETRLNIALLNVFDKKNTKELY